MNLGNAAVSAAPHLCRALRNVGMWDMTKQDLLDALKNHPKAPEAIFWWCYTWYSGVESDLYKIMCDDQLGYIPDPKRTAKVFVTDAKGEVQCTDPEVGELLSRLDEVFRPLVGQPYQLVKLAHVGEGHILIADGGFPCIDKGWPCRVYRWHGALGVACSGGVHGVKLLPGSETTFHPLVEDQRGYVIGFRR